MATPIRDRDGSFSGSQLLHSREVSTGRLRGSCRAPDPLYQVTPLAITIHIQLKNVLVKGGGQREFYPSELVSHVIADSLPPPSLGLSRCTSSILLHVRPRDIPVCVCLCIYNGRLLSHPQSDWVYMSSKCGVLLPYPITLSVCTV